MDTNELLEQILSLQPAVLAVGGISAEQKTLNIIEPLKAGIPNLIDTVMLKYKLRSDDSPLTVVLQQEI